MFLTIREQPSQTLLSKKTIFKAIKQAQDLSAKVHRSSNCQNDIKNVFLIQSLRLIKKPLDEFLTKNM